MANPRVSDDMISLFIASRNGDVERVHNLLDFCISINEADETGTTCLHVAANGGHVEIAKMLLAAGANINSPDKRKLSPLCVAAANNHTEMVEMLVNAGADVNTLGGYVGLSSSSLSPISSAIKNQNLGIVRVLLAAGAEVDYRYQNLFERKPLPMHEEVNEILRSLWRERNDLVTAVDELRHNPSTFFYQSFPKDLIEYVMRPMIMNRSNKK